MRRPTFAAVVSCFVAACALGAQPDANPLREATAARISGHMSRAVELLQAERARATTPDERARASGELGAALSQAGRLDEAQPLLEEAVAALGGVERARYTIDLANVAAQRGDDARAAALLREASSLAANSPRVALIAGLNLARLAPPAQRQAKLAALAPQIARVEDVRTRAMLHLNLGSQAAALGDDALRLAYVQLDMARDDASAARDIRLRAEALAALAALYESQGRSRDALTLAREALAQARSLDPARAADLAIELEWRVGRLAASLGDTDLALASYERAVAAIEAVRSDIPIEYDDGRSSYRATLEPVYLGYADLLFASLHGVPAERRGATLRRIRDVIELTRQAELQDYLRDRCDVEAIQRDAAGVGPGVAALYPVVFRDRIELLLETEAGIDWQTTRVDSRVVRATAADFARDMRGAADGYLPAAQALYRWLVAPFEARLQDARIDTLIVVPEGSLRLVPMGALHDGKRFLVERLAMGTVTGLTMTNTAPPARGAHEALVAGMSHPGPVVDKLPAPAMESILGSRGIPEGAQTRAQLREALALPGVGQEVAAISQIMKARSMLDEQFTVRAFEDQARSGDYRIVHIASHGVMGASADSSYIMAFDDVLRLRDLQSLLRDERFRRRPIELLSLSACQSAEGDDRSPLGISGAAVKARAKSVLGTLWPVEDNSARIVMESFYRHLERDGASKARALQEAQVEALHDARFAHPFFWAPFVLIGNWR